MFALTNSGGLAMSNAPDVCKVPSPGGLIPTPFPNMVQLTMADPSAICKKVFICGSPALTVKSKFLLSSGDEAGVGGGVVSGKFIGPAQFVPLAGSSKVNFEGAKAVMMTAQTQHNGSANFNTLGLVSLGGQTKVLVAK